MASPQVAALVASGAGSTNAITTITPFATVAASAAALNWPASLQAGDVAVIIQAAQSITGTGTPVSVVPSGFTLIGETYGVSPVRFRVNAARKILTGSESGTITGMTGNAYSDRTLYVFRPNVPCTLVTHKSYQGEVTAASGDPALQTVPSGSGSAPLIIMAMTGDGAGTPAFSTESPALTKQVSPGTGYTLTGYRIYTSAPVDGSYDATARTSPSVASALMTFFIELSA